MKYFPTFHRGEATDYPYGSLRTTAFFGIEFKPGFGFRTTFQTINPKTGRLNKPKTSTYFDLGLMYEDGGKLEYSRFNPRSLEELETAFAFFVEHYELFTAKEIEQWLMFSLTLVRMEATAAVRYSGADSADVIEVIRPTVEILVQLIKAPFKAGVALVGFPVKGLEALRNPNFNPFKVVNHGA